MNTTSYASSTLPRSLRKRSLSSLSWVSLSHRRQVSGEISSARTIAPSRSAELDFKVHQLYADALKILYHHFIDLQRVFSNGVDLFLRCQAQCQRIVIIDERIAQRIIFIAELQCGAKQLSAFFNAQFSWKNFLPRYFLRLLPAVRSELSLLRSLCHLILLQDG